MAAETPRALVWATDVDTLPPDRVVARRDGYLVVRSPRDPGFYWGNLLLFDDAPTAADATRWEALFDAELGVDDRIRHRTFAWDRTDGVAGAADEAFVARGYDLEESIGLVAARSQLRLHPRANRDVVVRELDAAPGADAGLWRAVAELQVASRDPAYEEHDYRTFVSARLDSRRQLFRAGRGAWYVAVDPDSGAVAGSLGIVVTGGRGRFQAVDTAEPFRRRGVCSRLVVEAAERAAGRYGAEQFVIVADAGYHALGLYESLGFERREHVFGVCRRPDSQA